MDIGVILTALSVDQETAIIILVAHMAGWFVKGFAPSWIPWLGRGNKLAKELLKVIDITPVPNSEIRELAKNVNANLAAKQIDKITRK